MLVGMASFCSLFAPCPFSMALKSASTLPTDEELLQRILQEDQDAISELYYRYCNLVYSLALYTLRDPDLAEEVTQDTFIKIWYRAETWKATKGKFSSWLMTIARYTAIDRIRSERRRLSCVVVPEEMITDEIGNLSFQREIYQEYRKEFCALIEQLPFEQAQAINLVFFHGLTHSQLAKVLNLPLGTVKARLRRGLRKLKTTFLETTA